MDTLTITKGAETLDFDGGGNFFVRWDRFPISVTKRRRSLLGGSLYEDTAERWTVNISGDDTGEAVDAADDLVRVIESAEDWWEGQDDDIVLVNYQPENSDLGAALKSVIIGAPSGRPVLQLPNDFDAVGLQPTIRDALLSFVRRGPWLAAAETANDTATATPAEMSVTFGTAAKNLSPIDIKLRSLDLADDGQIYIPAGVLFVYQEALDCALWEAESVTQSVFATHVDATASDGNVSRLTAATGFLNTQFTDSTLIGRNIALFASLQNTDSSTSWNITTSVGADSSALATAERTNVISLPTQDATKQTVLLGYFSRIQSDSYWWITADRTAGSGNLEIDYIIGINLDKPTTYIISNNAIAGTGTNTNVVMDFHYDSGALSLPAAAARIENQSSGAKVVPLDTRGDLAIHMQGDTVRVRYSGSGISGGANNRWLINDDNGAWSPLLRVTRYVAYTVPQ